VASNNCDCDNKENFETTIEFTCKKCKENIDTIRIKSPLKTMGIAAILAYSGSQFIDYAVTDNRYPTKIEHAVLKACINYDKTPLSSGDYKLKENLCLCALENTMNEISYIRYKVNKNGFLKSFKENTKYCIKLAD